MDEVMKLLFQTQGKIEEFAAALTKVPMRENPEPILSRLRELAADAMVKAEAVKAQELLEEQEEAARAAQLSAAKLGGSDDTRPRYADHEVRQAMRDLLRPDHPTSSEE